MRLLPLIAAASVALAAPAPAVGVDAWLPPVTISAPGYDAVLPLVGVDPQGNAIVVWTRTWPGGPAVEAATRPAGGSFGVPQLVSADGSCPQVALDSQGEAVAVWVDSSARIRAATRPAGGSFGPAQTISAGGEEAGCPQLAVGPRGDAVAVWERGARDPRTGFCHRRIEAAVRPAGGSFGPVQTISDATKTPALERRRSPRSTRSRSTSRETRSPPG